MLKYRNSALTVWPDIRPLEATILLISYIRKNPSNVRILNTEYVYLCTPRKHAFSHLSCMKPT